MREIKFRMWSKEYQQMFNMDHLQAMYAVGARMAKKYVPGVAESDVVMPEIGVSLPFQEDAILMQYVGTKDKYDNEIYDGDIVKDQHGIGEVKWLQEHCAFVVRTIDQHAYHYLESDGRLLNTQVIGNIYENPELLGGTP